MYTEESLKKYPYFAEELRTTGLWNMIDSLTVLVARAHILGFVKRLIEDGIPFTFAILDLDNFKFINKRIRTLKIVYPRMKKSQHILWMYGTTPSSTRSWQQT